MLLLGTAPSPHVLDLGPGVEAAHAAHVSVACTACNTSLSQLPGCLAEARSQPGWPLHATARPRRAALPQVEEQVRGARPPALPDRIETRRQRFCDQPCSMRMNCSRSSAGAGQRRTQGNCYNLLFIAPCWVHGTAALGSKPTEQGTHAQQKEGPSWMARELCIHSPRAAASWHACVCVGHPAINQVVQNLHSM